MFAVKKVNLDAFLTDRVETIMPEYKDIPEEFKTLSFYTKNKFIKICTQWFFQGLPKDTQFIPKEGVDKSDALLHLNAIMRSFSPKHEHKMAAVSFLMSEWFEDIILGEK